MFLIDYTSEGFILRADGETVFPVVPFYRQGHCLCSVFWRQVSSTALMSLI